MEKASAHIVDKAAARFEKAVGMAARPEKFERILGLLVDDAPPPWRTAVKVAIMRAAGYEYLDDVIGNEAFGVLIERARHRAPGFANEAGVIDEDALRARIGAADVPEWDALARNAGLVRIRGSLALRDTPPCTGVPRLARDRRGFHAGRDRRCRRDRRQLVPFQPSLVRSPLRPVHEGKSGG